MTALEFLLLKQAADRDNDGVVDSKESHGSLPKSFKGSHKDAVNLDRDKDGRPDVDEPHGRLRKGFKGGHAKAMMLIGKC